MAKRRTTVLKEPTNSLYLTTQPEAVIIAPNGNRYPVNITPEAAAVWTRYGFKVEWFATGKKVAA